MPLPNAYAVLLDKAVGRAKRHSHEQVLPVHLAAVLLDEDEDAWAPRLGEVRERIDAHLSSAPKGLESPDTAPARAFLENVAADGDTDDELADALRRAIAEEPTSLSAQEGAQPTAGDTSTSAATDDQSAARGSHETLPGILGAVATRLEPADTILGTGPQVESLIQLLARRHPRPALIVGKQGSGRTALARALAARLDDASYGGPLAGAPVIRIDAAEVVARQRAQTLDAALKAAAAIPNAIVVLDDLEVLFGLGWGSAVDLTAMTAVRAAIGQQDLRLVGTLESRYLSRFGTVDSELADEFAPVTLSELESSHLQQAAEAAAERLARHHELTIATEAILLASSPSQDGSRRGHPGLLVERLDAACVRASLRGSTVVEADDVPVGEAARLDLDADELRRTMQTAIVGQDEAVERVAARLALTKAQLDLRPERPDGVFLLVGPTGVGKTAFARTLNAHLHAGASSGLIRYDMSEFGQEHTVSRFVGPPPGYVGSTEPEGWITTKVRRDPHAVVLLDEIEKAHPKIWNILLQMFDAGRLTDSTGEPADFSQTVILMTSNLGSRSFSTPQLGFVPTGSSHAASSERVLETVRDTFPPELFGRLDDVLVFRQLSPEHILEITRLEVDHALTRLRERGYDVHVDDEAVRHLADRGYDPSRGARHVQRNIERLLLQGLVPLTPGTYTVGVSDDGLALRRS